MKLLDTIQDLITEAENNLYNESMKTDDPNEIKLLENNLENSLKLLNMYKNLL